MVSPRMHKTHPNYLFLLAMVIALLPIACEDVTNPETEMHLSLEAIIEDLQVAMSSGNENALDKVIADANRLRPSSQLQTQDKNLILSSAKEKLAQLRFLKLSTETIVVQHIFQVAEKQALQVALLHGYADTFHADSGQRETSISQQITSAHTSRQHQFKSQLNDSDAVITDLGSKSQTTREKAEELRTQAEHLLTQAEDNGIIKGHASYTSGIKILRQSQQNNAIAAELELQSHMKEEPLRDEAKAELEAISSILEGMKRTETLLQEFYDSTEQNASDFRKLATEIDAQAGKSLEEAVAQGSLLLQRWNNLSDLLQDAMSGIGRTRGASRTAQETSGMWKLDLEWTLGKVEESKRNLLLNEVSAINTFIEHGVHSSSTELIAISTALSELAEQATNEAIAAYENATLAASNLGPQTNAVLQQLETRMAILKGIHTPKPVANEDTNTSSKPVVTSSQSGNGFASPEELVSAFNSALDISSFDGTSPVTNLNTFCQAQDPGAEKFLAFMNNIMQATGDLLTAIRTNIGEAAIAQFMAMNPASSQTSAMQVDPTSIIQIGENNASASEVSGKPVQMQLTTDGWKIILSSTQDPQAAMAIEMMSTMFTPIFDAMNSITEQLNNGQITTLEQINDAMMGAMENINPF